MVIPMAETFELTPDQWSTLMGRLGKGYGAFDDMVAHIGIRNMFSKTYIVQGGNENEIHSKGFAAVANGGQGAVASVEVRYPPRSGKPASYAVTTFDPAIVREIHGLGVKGKEDSAAEERMRIFREINDMLAKPDNRAAEYSRAVAEMMMSRPLQRMLDKKDDERDRIMNEFANRMTDLKQPSVKQPLPNSGRDRILGEAGRALEGSPFVMPSPLGISLAEAYQKRLEDRDTIRTGPGTGVKMPEVGGGSTGFMKYIEPGGFSSVYTGSRRLYSDFPINEKNEFSRNQKPAGILRIYGPPDNPARSEVITDNPALRSIMEKAKIPVRPLTEPQNEQEKAKGRS